MFGKFKESLVGKWMAAGGYGYVVSFVAVVLYLAPAAILLDFLKYGEEVIAHPALWLWAGSSCGFLLGVAEGKRKATVEEPE